MFLCYALQCMYICYIVICAYIIGYLVCIFDAMLYVQYYNTDNTHIMCLYIICPHHVLTFPSIQNLST